MLILNAPIKRYRVSEWLKKQDPGCLGGSGVKSLPLTQGVILESGIESHIGVPVGSLLLSWPNFLPLSLSLSLSLSLMLSKIKLLGSLGGAVFWCLPLAQGAILETQDRIPRQAPGAWSLLLPLPMSLPLSLSLSLSL